MIHPLEKIYVTSPFGDRIHPVEGVYKKHNGVDYRGDIGDLIFAPETGVVKSVYYSSSGGKQMILEHSGGITTGYAHLSDYLVKEGDFVVRGRPIAKLGDTGPVTGPHLHWTVKRNGDYLDPEKYIKMQKLKGVLFLALFGFLLFKLK